ncbi:HNH endonuclease [Massilia sp. YIM B02769]|uniref:HNH endonuclease n=1 Tax=Massilia sp. YIM B02769 TaxID=3050129 RepID=UPI0025B6EEE3|nr:HNH endonuclease [Massilia sp. YIM B02769]MDN4061153.1 HNH endonuclease [Massilia sp. YIM B02769]
MAEIQLLHGEVALVDDDMVEVLSRYRWHADSRGYVVAHTGDQIVRMHRIVMKPGVEQVVDHVNGDKLDNRRSNLRSCTHAENMRNRKMHENNQCGAKGVYMDSRKRRNPYRAQIRVDGVKIGLGSFGTLEDASAAYRAAAKKYHGDFAAI